MGDRARQFVEQRVAENVHASGYEPEGDKIESRRLALACWAAADQAGVARASIQEEFGDLLDYMAEHLEAVNDAEVQRLVDKDSS